MRRADWTLLDSCLVLEIYIRLVGVYTAIFLFHLTRPLAVRHPLARLFPSLGE